MVTLALPQKIADSMASLTEAITEAIYRDALTGLLNYSGFQQFLYPWSLNAQESGQALYLFLVEVDEMKRLNTKYGYRNADTILKKLARLLDAYVQSPSTEEIFVQTQVFRRSGDEFFILQLLPPGSSVQDWLENLLRDVRAVRVTLNNEPVSFTVSIGYAQFAPDESSEKFEAHVEQAVKLAKKNGRDRAERYSPETCAVVDTRDYRKDCATCGSFFSVSVPYTRADLPSLRCPVCQSEIAL